MGIGPLRFLGSNSVLEQLIRHQNLAQFTVK